MLVFSCIIMTIIDFTLILLVILKFIEITNEENQRKDNKKEDEDELK